MGTETDNACATAIELNRLWGEKAMGESPTSYFVFGREGTAHAVSSALWGEVLQREKAAQEPSSTPEGATSPAAVALPPFSFNYGGVPSAAFLASWSHESSETVDGDRIRRILTYRDAASGLEVRVESTTFTDTPGVDWTIYLTNRGAADTPVIEHFRALDVLIDPTLPEGYHPANQVAVHRMNGTTSGFKYSPDDFLPLKNLLLRGERVDFGNANAPFGCSSVYASPFFNVDWQGGGVVTAIGWSGQWDASVSYGQDGKLRVDAGMSNMRLKLHPGESIRTPRILQVYWKADEPLRSYNLFRRTMFRHVLPRTGGELVLPPIACSPNMWVLQNEGTIKDVYDYLKGVEGCGFEMCWIDAFYMERGWPLGVGNYGDPVDMLWDKKRFPEGLRPVREKAREMGMEFLVWFAPERAEPGTDIYIKHPEWLIKPDGSDVTGMYDLGNPDALAYMTDYLKTITRELALDCIRFDCGAITDRMVLKDRKEADRDGMAMIRYHEGLYRMWDELLQTFPDLYIDNCCGGGTRIDLETCSRSLPLWRTDGTGWPIMMWVPRDLDEGAMQNQIITAGLSRYLPFHTGGQVGTTPYLFRSAFNVGYVMADDARAADFDRVGVTKAIAEAKRVRPFFLGDFYPISEVTTSPEDWCVTQYHRPNDGDGIVRAFRRHKSPFPEYVCRLYDIDPNSEYDVSVSLTFDAAAPQRMSGADLRNLTLRIPEMPGSALVEYRLVR